MQKKYAMKKIFTSIALCFVSVIAMSQSWNVLNNEFNLGSSDTKYSDGNVAVPIYEQITSERRGEIYVNSIVVKDYKYVPLPKSVFEEYKAGVTHVKVGSVMKKQANWNYSLYNEILEHK